MKNGMKIGVLGTGPVGQTVAAKLAELGTRVFVGTRDPAATLARTDPGQLRQPAVQGLAREAPEDRARHARPQAAAHGELVVNATSGTGSLEALKAAGEKNLAGKILIDIANPLDFSQGMPPSLTVCNTDSLGEQIQRAFPAGQGGQDAEHDERVPDGGPGPARGRRAHDVRLAATTPRRRRA